MTLGKNSGAEKVESVPTLQKELEEQLAEKERQG